MIQPAKKKLKGRPPTVTGKQVQLYLDSDSLAIAAEIGEGNISLGVRIALKKYQKKEKS